MWATHRKKWIVGGAAFILIGVLLILLRGDDNEEIPPDLDARARFVGTALVAQNLPAFRRLAGGAENMHGEQWYAAAQSAIPDVLREPQLTLVYDTETKFESNDKGTACVLVTVVPSDTALANTLSDDASLPEANLLLYWELNDSGEWNLDCAKCLREFRMDRGSNWSGRLGDRKNFRQDNK